jgi:hypothetical protein
VFDGRVELSQQVRAIDAFLRDGLAREGLLDCLGVGTYFLHASRASLCGCCTDVVHLQLRGRHLDSRLEDADAGE